MILAAVAHGHVNGWHLASILLVVAIIACVIVGLLVLLKAFTTRAPWWAWLLAAVVLFILWDVLPTS